MQLDYQKQLAVHNPYELGFRIFAWSTVASLVWGIASTFIVVAGNRSSDFSHTPDAYVAYTGMVLGMLGLVCLPGLSFVWTERNAISRCRAMMTEGRYLVRWRYTDDHWARFRASQQPAENKRWWAIVLVLSIIAAILGLIGIVVAILPPPAHVYDRDGHVIAGVVMMGIAIVPAIIVISYVMISAGIRQRLQTPQPTVLCTQGLYANGRWMTWGTAWRTLSKVRVVDGNTEKPLTIAIATSGGNSVTELSVLVPDGQEVLAVTIAERIQRAPEATRGGQAGLLFVAFRLLILVLRIFV